MGTTAVATMAIVIVLSVFNGFRDLAHSRFSKLTPPYKIVATDGKPFSLQLSLEDSDHDPEGNVLVPGKWAHESRFYPVVEVKAYVTTGNAQTMAEIVGVDNSWIEQSGIAGALLTGVAYVGDTLGCNWGTSGVGIAQRLNVWPGMDVPVKVSVPRSKGRINPGSLLSSFRTDSLLLAGVFSIDDVEADETIMLASISSARFLAGVDSMSVTALYVYPDYGFDKKSFYDAFHGSQFEVLDVERQNVHAFRMINIEKWISFSLLGFILLIASVNIISTLSMLIIEKRGNMGILHAMGLSIRRIRNIFIWEGLLLSVFGALLGAILGSILVLCQQWWGLIKISGDIDPAMLTVDSYPVALNIYDFLIVFGLIIILSLVVTAVAVKGIDDGEVGVAMSNKE